MKTVKINIDDNALHINRVLEAPLQVVWKAWTNPTQIANWWGPSGFTNTIHTMELMPGGEWKLTMHGPDGKGYPNKSVFKEIIPFEKIVFQHYNPDYLATIQFVAKENQTVMDWRMQFETAKLFEAVVKVFKADEGLRQNVEKLEAHLEQQLSSSVKSTI